MDRKVIETDGFTDHTIPISIDGLRLFSGLLNNIGLLRALPSLKCHCVHSHRKKGLLTQTRMEGLV